MAKEERVWITLEENIFTGKIEIEAHVDSRVAIEHAHNAIKCCPNNIVYAFSVIRVSKD